ncbi:unnamed protein product, partial [Symbiodinium sp. KB8]
EFAVEWDRYDDARTRDECRRHELPVSHRVDEASNSGDVFFEDNGSSAYDCDYGWEDSEIY